MEGSVVLDVGKTISKLTLWSGDGQLLARETRANARVQGPGYAALDVQGIQAWLLETLAKFAREANDPRDHSGCAWSLCRDCSEQRTRLTADGL